MSTSSDRLERHQVISAEVKAAVVNPALYRRAADLIRTKGHTREVFAATAPADEKGMPCDIIDPEATCFCIMGALARAGVDLGLFHPEPEISGWTGWSDADSYGFSMISDATRIMGLPRSANSWNNQTTRTAAEVIAALETGAARLEHGDR